MPMTEEQLRDLALISIDGEMNRHSIDQFCQTYPDITEMEGYRGQEIRLAIMEEKGFKPVGYKLGGTSMAKMAQIKSDIYSSAAGVTNSSQITYGILMDYMRMEYCADLHLSNHIHPKVEPEIAFIMKEDISGPNVKAVDVMFATEKICPAFEVIDSRFHNFKIGRRYDALIDNTSSSAFMLSPEGIDPVGKNIRDIGMKLFYNGEYVAFGAGASTMGHPARAVAELVRMLSRVGGGLKAGDIILSGAITASRPVHEGDYIRADFGGLGYVETHVVL
ncbi:MAG: fumarylacetoacetate hydrolase family protein [Lachnospiraceae bacterium]|nr:fumarylacetoacetate hydrolase family protein [Lachnospiraceae bacterium]